MTTLRIAGVPEPYNLPWHLAMEQGRFAEAGIDLQWHTVHEGTGRMCQMLRDGELDMAVLVTEGAVRDILNGGPHRIVSTFVESPLPWGVHVPASSALHHPSDLKGVPFAISRLGSGSHIMAMLYAERLGWRPRPEDLVVVHNMEGAARRMAEGPPVIFLWETYVTSHYVEAGVMRRVDEVRGDWPGFVIVAREEFALAHQGTMQEALAVLDRAVRGLDHSAHTVDLVTQNAGFRNELAREWLRHVRWQVARPDGRVLQPLIATLQDLALVPEDADLTRVCCGPQE
ncbi:MAG: ABC transporter substrate-binding protein [Flavobacteriales bacterium]|nr:MAG: ABC transporter substrate-binding protein [Flavobacteriales bacterium]